MANVESVEQIATVQAASDREAQQLLSYQDERDINLEVSGIALVMAAGMLIGRVAENEQNLETLATHLASIFMLRARESFDCRGQRMN
jgi:hypothetical protein